MKRVIFALFFISVFVFQSAHAGDIENEYLKAKSCYGEAKIAKPQKRDDWKRCVSLFENIQRKNPKSERGMQSLFNAGKLNGELYQRFHKLEDVETAIRYYNQFVKEYPSDTLADDALYQIGMLRHNPLKQDDKAKHAFNYIVENYPTGDMAGKAKQELASLGDADLIDKSAEADETGPSKEIEKPKEKEAAAAKGDLEMAGPRQLATLGSIDIEKAEAETAIQLNLTRKAPYAIKFVTSGAHTSSPPRLELLLTYTKIDPNLSKEVSVSSPFLKNITIKKAVLDGGVRLVFEMGPNSTYEISARNEKIIVHFMREGTEKGAPLKSSKKKTATLERVKPFVVVIDPGHGGTDTGAIGPKGTEEKSVTLAVSKELSSRLKDELNARVYLTRDSDRTLSLEDRNAVAVAKKADLFISIHANAAKNRKMTGIETYYLNNATDEAAAKLARRENLSSKKKVSDVEHILSTMLQNYDAAESAVLARDVQGALIGRMSKKYSGVRNRRVRSAMFYVLVGAKCPAILVETSFISNPEEEKRLRNKDYQKELAGSILKGVEKYKSSEDKRVVAL